MRNMSGLPDALGDAARVYLDTLPAGDVVAFSLTPLDRTGLPVWVVSLFPTDAALAGIMPYGVGYGVTDEAAVLGGLGEIAEMVWPTLTLGTRAKTRGSHADLVAGLGTDAVADPLTLCLPAGSPVTRDTPLDWVEATRARDGGTVLVPIDLAAYSAKELAPGYRAFTTIISNGMGAGPDIDWAVGHGLCEILQRDGNGLSFRALDAGVLLDLPDGVAGDLLGRFADAGIRVYPKFATDQFGIPNLYCCGHDESREPPVPITVTACGEGCHPDAGQALEKALTEFAASRVRKAFAHGTAALAERVAPPGYVERFLAQAGGAAKNSDPRAMAAMRDWTARGAAELAGYLADSVFSVRTRKPFADLPSTPAADARARGRVARDLVEAAGFDILYVDMSPPGRGVAVAKVIVPGMEVETMSYARIGPRGVAKCLAADNGLVRFGAPSETLRPIRMTPEAIAAYSEPPLFDTARRDAIVGPLYPLYREPEAHSMAAPA